MGAECLRPYCHFASNHSGFRQFSWRKLSVQSYRMLLKRWFYLSFGPTFGTIRGVPLRVLTAVFGWIRGYSQHRDEVVGQVVGSGGDRL